MTHNNYKNLNGIEKPTNLPIPPPNNSTMTISGITFTADQIVSVVLKIDGREIHIQEKEKSNKQIGFLEDK